MTDVMTLVAILDLAAILEFLYQSNKINITNIDIFLVL